MIRRLVVLGALAASISAGILVDANAPAPAKPSVPSDDNVPINSALSSAWFCASVPASRAAPGDGVVTIANTSGKAVVGTATVFPTNGRSVDVPVTLPARARVSLRPGDVVDAPFAAVQVHVDAGGVGVEQSMRWAPGQRGFSYSPCALGGSYTWHIADASTQDGATFQLGLFNPFLEDAVADITLLSPDGPSQPKDLQGVLVPAHSMSVVDVSSRARRRDWISTTLQTRGGRLVVDQIQSGPMGGSPGGALLTASSQLSDHWMFPTGSISDVDADRLSIYNPGDKDSTATVTLKPDAGTPVVYKVEVGSHDREQVSYAQDPRLPRGVGYSVDVRMSNDAQVVVSRRAITTSGPAPTGAVMENGVSTSAKRWLIVEGNTSPPAREVVSVFNPGPLSAAVNVSAFGEGKVDGLHSPIEVPPGARQVIDLSTIPGGVQRSVMIDSDEPVAVDSTFGTLNTASKSTRVGIPLR